MALVGGLIFGCLLVWVLGAASRRLSSPAELMEKARIEPLVVIPPGGGTRAELQRERQLRQLAATVALLDVPKPAVVAVAAVERMPGTDEIAESLARYRADHGARTVLVHADGAPAPLDAAEGDIESVAVKWLLASSESGGRMREVFPVADPQDAHGLFGMEHLGKLVTSLRSSADLIVIQSPAVSDSAESYMVCAVADRTLLVAGPARPRIPSWPPGTRWSGSACPCWGWPSWSGRDGRARSRVAMTVPRPCGAPAHRIVRVPRHQRHGPHHTTATRAPE